MKTDLIKNNFQLACSRVRTKYYRDGTRRGDEETDENCAFVKKKTEL